MKNPEKDIFPILSPGDLPDAASLLLDGCGSARVFVFRGDLGAGKTTLIKELCRSLGVTEPVTSPTFSLVNEYRGFLPSLGAFPVFHMDLYRLESAEEAHAIGLDQYLYGDGYCFIEWPDLIAAWLPEETLHIELVISGPESRIMTVARSLPTGREAAGRPG